MLSVQQLTVRHGDVVAVRDLSFRCDPGRIVSILGPNGAGKTTLFEALYGFLPIEGQLRWQDRPLERGDIAYLPASLSLYGGLTCRETLSLFAPSVPQDVVERIAGEFGVPLDLMVGVCSFGTERKLGLLGVLLMRRPIALLDEPSNGLDLESNLMLHRALAAMRQAGTLVLLATHLFEQALSVSDEILVLDGGTLRGSYVAPDFEALRHELGARGGKPSTLEAWLSNGA